MTKSVELRAKTYSYLIADVSENKKTTEIKKCVIKTTLKLENCKNVLDTTQLDNKINYLEKNKINVDSSFCYKRKHKELIKNNKLILEIQQRFKRERHNIFTEDINCFKYRRMQKNAINSFHRNICIWNKQRFSK